MALQVRSRSTVVAQRPELGGEVGARCGDHPSLARRDRLPRVEAEAPEIAERSDMRALVPGTEASGGVLHGPEPMPASNIEDWAHLRGQAEQVHRDDPDGPRGDRRFGLGYIEIERFEVDVDEDGPAAQV